jgi:DnaJ like chaperone protein
MGGFVKWIGAVSGWLAGEWLGGRFGWEVGGPAGCLLGFIVGTVIDSFEIRLFRKSAKKIEMGVFASSLLVLIAAVIKAEGPVVRLEIDYVKTFLKQNYGEKEAKKALSRLSKILKQNFPLDNACELVLHHLDYSSRLQLTHFLYNLAKIDKPVSEAEQKILNRINAALKVSVSDKRSVGSVFVQEDSIILAYGILGIHRSSSILDIKKAYRNLATKYHPDKVAFLGEDMKKIANEKFQQLSRAYETIKKERHFI